MSRKDLVLSTTRIFAVLFIAMFLGKHLHREKSIISSLNQPTFGNRFARVQLVIFQEFKCKRCKEFHEEIFPYLKTHYIDTGKAQFTFIPLAFLPRSKPMAKAALGIYEQKPELFLPFVEMLYENYRYFTSNEDMIMMAEGLPGISLKKLRRDLYSNKYDSILEHNFEEAEKVMGKPMATPSLFINGSPVSPFSLEVIVSNIERNKGK